MIELVALVVALVAMGLLASQRGEDSRETGIEQVRTVYLLR